MQRPFEGYHGGGGARVLLEEKHQSPIAGGASDRPDPYCLRPYGCPVRDAATGPRSAPSVRTNPSTSSPRALAKPLSSPEISKPHFCRTRIEPRLSLATRANRGRVASCRRNSRSAT